MLFVGFSAVGASAAKQPNGSLSVSYARVDEISKNSLRLTAIGGVSAEGIGKLLVGTSLEADTSSLPASVRSLVTSKNTVVRVAGYVTDDSYSKTEQKLLSMNCDSKGNCNPTYLYETKRVAKYTLRVDQLQIAEGARCARSQSVGIDVPWQLSGASFAVDVCRTRDATIAYVPSSDKYTVVSVAGVVKPGVTIALRTQPGYWTSTVVNFNVSSLIVSYDILNDGKPPVSGKALSIQF